MLRRFWSIPAPNVKKWVGKVLGSEEEIEEALKTLKREPKSKEELQAVISEMQKKEIAKTAEESRNSFY